MGQELRTLIGQVRTIANEKGIDAISLKELHNNSGISKEQLDKHFPSEEVLVEKILEDERRNFEEIFVQHDFDGYFDAIDILFTVGKEMSRKFYHLSPSITHRYEQMYPEIYQKHIDERINFIYDKIQINLQKGISQGMYRDDVSIELVARLYIRRLIDLHDTENFPPEDFSFDTMFSQMFERFVRSIATEEGIKYFEKKKKATKLKS
jgi:AcrR family transcriptional regulator